MANPILAQTDPDSGTKVQLRIKYASSCKDHTYEIRSVKNDGIVFSGLLNVPCCGEAKIPFHDAAKTSVMTPVVHKCVCYLDWEVKDGNEKTIGHVKEPTCTQLLQRHYCPWWDAVLLRACDAEDKQDRFTIRRPGLCNICCPGCGNCKGCECGGCNINCPDCKCDHLCDMCKCEFYMKVNIHDGDMSHRDPVAFVEWHGKRNCFSGRLLPSYRFTVNCPPTCTYNDTALLVLMAIYLDVVLIPGAIREMPCTGEN